MFKIVAYSVFLFVFLAPWAYRSIERRHIDLNGIISDAVETLGDAINRNNPSRPTGIPKEDRLR